MCDTKGADNRFLGLKHRSEVQRRPFGVQKDILCQEQVSIVHNDGPGIVPIGRHTLFYLQFGLTAPTPTVGACPRL